MLNCCSCQISTVVLCICLKHFTPAASCVESGTLVKSFISLTRRSLFCHLDTLPCSHCCLPSHQNLKSWEDYADLAQDNLLNPWVNVAAVFWFYPLSWRRVMICVSWTCCVNIPVITFCLAGWVLWKGTAAGIWDVCICWLSKNWSTAVSKFLDLWKVQVLPFDLRDRNYSVIGIKPYNWCTKGCVCYFTFLKNDTESHVI